LSAEQKNAQEVGDGKKEINITFKLNVSHENKNRNGKKEDTKKRGSKPGEATRKGNNGW